MRPGVETGWRCEAGAWFNARLAVPWMLGPVPTVEGARTRVAHDIFDFPKKPLLDRVASAMLAARVRLGLLVVAAASRAMRCRLQPTSPQLRVMNTTRARHTPGPSNSAHQPLHWQLSAQLAQHRIPAHTAHAAHARHQQGSRRGTTRRQTHAHRHGGPANARCSPHSSSTPPGHQHHRGQ